MGLSEFSNRFSMDESLAVEAGHNPYYLRIDSGLDEKIRVTARSRS